MRHPIFARVFDRLCPMLEREAGRHRAELVAGLTGRVVEIGAGNGANFRHYPATVDEVVALEPESYLRGKAQQAARDAVVHVSVGEDPADALPLADAALDAAVVSLVLCTVRQLVESCTALRDRGADIVAVLCVIDRETGGVDNLAAHDLHLRSLWTMTQLQRASCLAVGPPRAG